MRVLYANPVFLDYRIPFYITLNSLFKGDFHVLYSENRYKILGRVDLLERIKREMDGFEHSLSTDYLFDTHSMSFHLKDIEKGRHIPFTFGLLRKIHKIKPDVLITEGFFQWTPLCILYSILFRIPVYIGYERTPHTERNAGFLKKWHRKLTDKFVKGYLVNGSETRKYLRSIGIDNCKIHIGGMSADSLGLRNGISKLSKEDIDLSKIELSIPKNGFVYLFVGRICERKGISEILSVWDDHKKGCKDDHLLVVGGGSDLETLQKKYRDESSVHFIGPVDYDRVAKYYAMSDVFILPTLEDNWSLVIPEAMACGKPVATTIFNGCHPELVKHGINGTVFNPLDRASMLKALDYFHHIDLESFGKASIAIEKDFNCEACASRVYDTLTNDNEV